MISRAFSLFFFTPVDFAGLLVSVASSGFFESSESAWTVQICFLQTTKRVKNNPVVKYKHEHLTFFCFHFLLFLIIRFFLSHSYSYLPAFILFDFCYGPLCVIFHWKRNISEATTFFSLCKQNTLIRNHEHRNSDYICDLFFFSSLMGKKRE